MSDTSVAEQLDDRKNSTPSRVYERLRNYLWGYDFFISYNWASGGKYALKLATLLQARCYDVFLDHDEYAAGDDWKKIGDIALRNTHRLVLIATREAVLDSDSVKREVEVFTARRSHIIPIVFGKGPFANELKAKRGEYPVLDRLSGATLQIRDEMGNLSDHGPPKQVVDRVVRSHKTVRRRQLRLALTVVALFLLSTFSVVAGFSWHNAARQQRLAERRFQSVRELVQSAIFDIHDQIETIPGSTAVRKQLVDDGLRYLDDLEREVGDDVELLAELRGGYNKLGDVQGNHRANLGDTNGAMRSYRKGLELAERIAKLTRNTDAKNRAWLQAQDNLAVSYSLIADIHVKQGNLKAALEDYSLAVDKLKATLAEFPDYDQAKRQLVVAFNRIGSLQASLADFDKALESFKAAMTMTKELAMESPNNLQFQRDLMVSHLQLGDIFDSLRKPDESMIEYESAYEIAQRLSKGESSNDRIRRDLAVCAERLGNGLARNGRFEESLDKLGAALKIHQSRVRSDPDNVLPSVIYRLPMGESVTCWDNPADWRRPRDI